MDALVERYLDELQQVVFVLEKNLPITILLDRIIDQLARFHESHAGFRVLFLEVNVEHRIQSVLVQLIETIIGQYFPALDADLRWQTAIIWLGIYRGIMQLTEPLHNVLESTARSETKLALLSYLRAALVRTGIPLPEDLAW